MPPFGAATVPTLCYSGRVCLFTFPCSDLIISPIFMFWCKQTCFSDNGRVQFYYIHVINHAIIDSQFSRGRLYIRFLLMRDFFLARLNLGSSPHLTHLGQLKHNDFNASISFTTRWLLIPVINYMHCLHYMN